MAKYKPGYTKEDIGKADTRVNLSGSSPQQILTGEEAAQRAVAENEAWLLARKMNRTAKDNQSVKDILESMGFTVLGEYDDLFFNVQSPKGWTKKTDGYWTIVKDEKGKERITQFFKGAFYDRDAFLNIS